QAWDVKTAKERYRVAAHKGHVSDVAFAPGGKVLATAGEDGMIRLWDAALGKELVSCTGHVGGLHAVAVAPDGETLAYAGQGRGTRLWSTTTGKERGARTGHVYGPRSVAFLPDARNIVSVGPKGVYLWGALTGEALGTLMSFKADKRVNVALRADGRVVAV